jgi:CDP-diacylglycerol--glycerol-3-phosphate 3-phosphatidyltransferase
MNLPNTITLSRLLGLPFIFALLQFPDPLYHWWAVGIFGLAAGTDWLDGYLARRLDQVTEMGKFLDPLVDKLLVLGPLLILVQWQQIPAWAVFLILARELGIAGWRINPQLSGNGLIQGANLWGKLKTITQMAAIAVLLTPLSGQVEQVGLGLFWLSLVLTLISGLIYVIPTKGEAVT